MNDKIVYIIFILFVTTSSYPSFASEREYKKIMKSFVKENKGNLLSPSDNISLAWKDISVGFKYSYFIEDGIYKTNASYELTEVNQNKYIFNYFENNKKTDRQKINIKGLVYDYKNGEVGKSYGFSNCIFTLGECSYMGYKREKSVKVTYKKGVWKYKWVYSGLAGIGTRHVAYDKKGLVLYSWTKYENKLQDILRFASIKRVL